ncbi:hypothetical protein BD408DRAFT_424305 [Parasitella parasitica]|nr:hypothetical protein BD408DRAFT_424305 [Parasitella parasitica]
MHHDSFACIGLVSRKISRIHMRIYSLFLTLCEMTCLLQVFSIILPSPPHFYVL